MGMKLDDRMTCAIYGRRAWHNRPPELYCIEGEYVTMQQIAKRLGVSVEAAKRRWGKLRNKPGPITWGALGEALLQRK